MFVFVQRDIGKTVLWYTNNRLFGQSEKQAMIHCEMASGAEMVHRFPKAENQGLFLSLGGFICQ